MNSEWYPMSSCKLFLFIILIACLRTQKVDFRKFLCLKTDQKGWWIFWSFKLLLKLNVGIFYFISTTTEIQHLVFSHSSYVRFIFSAQPYLLVWQICWKTFRRMSSIFIVRGDRISTRLFSWSPEVARILPSCVTSSKLLKRSAPSLERRMEWHDFDLISLIVQLPNIKWSLKRFFGIQIITSLLPSISAGCQTCFVCQGSMSLLKRTSWETAIICFSWHVCWSTF